MDNEVFTIDESTVSVGLTINGSSHGEQIVEDGTTILHFVNSQAKCGPHGMGRR